jgi:hypothetical protein
MKNTYKMLVEYGETLRDLDIHDSILLKWIVEKEGVKVKGKVVPVL